METSDHLLHSQKQLRTLLGNLRAIGGSQPTVTIAASRTSLSPKLPRHKSEVPFHSQLFCTFVVRYLGLVSVAEACPESSPSSFRALRLI